MPIFYNDGGNQKKVAQPYLKRSGSWTPAKKIFSKVAGKWEEIWPSYLVYTHTGYGNNLNMAACFGNPTQPGNFIFINEGVIGGTTGTIDPALVTGVFPEGSSLQFINRGRVLGTGGDAASFTTYSGGVRHPKGGGMALRLEFPTLIDNTTGIIGGGGGGGGSSGDFIGNLIHFVGGAGGAGYPGGRVKLDTWWNAHGQPGTELLGGAGYLNTATVTYGKGGDLGQAGNPELRLWDDDKSKIQPGAPGGVSIANYGYVLEGSVGLGSDRVFGRTLPGTGLGNFYFTSFTGDGSWGNKLYVNFEVNGTGRNVAYTWVSGGAGIVVTKNSNTQYSFHAPGAGSMVDRMVKRTGVVRFILTTAQGNDSFEMRLDLCEDYTYGEDNATTCFVAGSMVTMADGSKKPIELVGIGEYVKTAVGVTRVKGLQRPLLANRPLYYLEDGTFGATADHSVWTRDPYTFEQWWGVRDMAIWEYEAEIGEGPDFGGHKPFDLTDMEGQHWDFAHESGWKRSRWYLVDAPPETRVYHLLLEEGGSYFVDGILVSSMADQSGVDWENFKWYP